MAFLELTSAIALAALAFLVLMLHSTKQGKKPEKKKKVSLRQELEEMDKARINRALAVTFVTIVALLMMPLLAATATGDIAVFDGKVGVLALLAFFTATYAIIAIHSVLGRD